MSDILGYAPPLFITRKEIDIIVDAKAKSVDATYRALKAPRRVSTKKISGKPLASAASGLDLVTFAFLSLPFRPSGEPKQISNYPPRGQRTICKPVSESRSRRARLVECPCGNRIIVVVLRHRSFSKGCSLKRPSRHLLLWSAGRMVDGILLTRREYESRHWAARSKSASDKVGI
ncbi:hypothetical protein [Mesorhizobium sp.]|uniref:hypothetical protein n=1 Tax=Mesorhizobium sp. TaxID=1871066 RepID=UPI000FE98A8F|nr:hypothetical protein [Mesorhizobium sp.]RWK55919.1 MAG: hypothetical protein EOR48_09875 [Mesorhizobium sp.]